MYQRSICVAIIPGALFVGTLLSPRPSQTYASWVPQTATRIQNERTLTRSLWRNEPVEISEVKQQKGSIEFGRAFTDDDDWLKGLTLSVKNTSNKDIVFIGVELTLFNKEAGYEHRTPVGFPFSYDARSGISDGPNGDHPIRPGESVEVSLSDENHELLKELLLKANYPLKFHRVDLRVDCVIFADGVMWYKASSFIRDPNNPSKYIRDKYLRKGAG